jgi:mannose-6-phosphate isomerase-like protein (cupin superfamily)
MKRSLKDSLSEEKKKLPEGESIDTYDVFKMLKEPSLINIDLPYEYIKSWGKELWFENNEKYCGKLLTIYHGYWSSKGKFHYHKIKDETFYVIFGSLHLDVEIDGVIRSLTLDPHSSFRVKPNIKHRFTCAGGLFCQFIEVSTNHQDSDSYRCYWDYKKQKWVED